MKKLCLIMMCFSLGLVSCKFSSSKVSSASINFGNLPADVDGYSVCLEKKNGSETGCSVGFFKENDTKTTALEKVYKNCTSGYKLKMWLWKKDTDGKKKPMYALNTDFEPDKNKYEGGYLLIPKEKLAEDTLKLKVNLLPVKGSGAIGVASDDKVDLDIQVEIEGENKPVATTTGGTPATTNQNRKEVDVDIKCSFNAPDGIIHQYVSDQDVKAKSGGYPSMRIYTNGAGCPACVDYENYITGKGKAYFKGKIHMYKSPGTGTPTGTVPATVFFDKNGDKLPGHIGYNNQAVANKVAELSK